MSFVDPASDRYSAWVPVIIHVISYNIGPRYNGTQLYVYVYIYIYIYTRMYNRIAWHTSWGWLHGYDHIHDEQCKFKTQYYFCSSSYGPSLHLFQALCQSQNKWQLLSYLTHCGLVTPYRVIELSNLVLVMAYFLNQRRLIINGLCGIHWRAISQALNMNLMCHMCSTITFFKLLPSPRGHELKW